MRHCGHARNLQSLVGGTVVPNYVDNAIIRIPGLDLGKQLYRADPISCRWLDKRRIEGLKIERTVDIHATTPRSGADGWI